ncbi:evolutionarily conserved C-terminal region 2 [Arabidopsis thaliana]|uniref:YTH domain-containing family protein n=1 Tax=Arabidopsis thaliana TaxID=3702 RepID=F4JDC2_ARATH|nr:evolutionarily conserved C-terminal region 2 [Arabidopsis thaliana]AEE75359.1 evolutionarily conserved C-terminal region 2 [Arabidopsis thaliana]|eukprot:NP_850578.1 evolutionarily conserved C-terminal region 2 [Arabidopsis thaliana]
MATVAPPADHLLQKLSLDSPAKASEIPEPNKKTAVYQYGGVDVHGQVPSYDRSLTPMLPSDAADPSVCYVPNPYNPYQYYNVYGSGQEWTDYPAYTNPEGVDMNSGIYGENGTVVYPQGYGYAAYPYSPATSPAPQLGGEGQLYGAQQYQYPNYFPNSGPYASSVATPTQPDLSANKPAGVKTLPADSNNVASAAGITKGSNGSAPVKPTNQATLNTSSNLYGMGAPGGGLAAGYQDPRYAYEGYYAPVPWHDGSKYSDVQRPVSGSGVASSYSKSSTVPSSRNQNYRSNSHYTSVHQPSSVTGYGTAQGYYNRMYQNKLYGQYGSTGRSALGYGSSGYDSRTNGRGWAATDNKYRSWGRGNSYYYGNENNVDGLNELNRGPRAKGTKNQKGNLDDSLEVKEQTGESNVTEVGEADNTCVVPDREQYNKEDFPVDYANAMFFIIKSYSEDDVHKSIKYNVWASTPNGNKKLAAAYQEAQQKAGGCPIFLFFSVNASGQFVGLAEMTGPVDFNTNVEYWQQDKWTGSFPLKWHIVKDVPNSLLKHITLENNENKPVTNSRDTQEVKLEQGLKIVKIFKEHSSKTCILDDFSFYEVRQKTILEKKAKQTQKQVSEEKVTDEKKESATAESASKESPAAVQTSSDVKVAENGSVAKPVTGDVVANGC